MKKILQLIACNKLMRNILLKLPNWNWALYLLYPPDIEIEFKEQQGSEDGRRQDAKKTKT